MPNEDIIFTMETYLVDSGVMYRSRGHSAVNVEGSDAQLKIGARAKVEIEV